MIYLPPYVNLLDWSQLDILLDCPWFAHSVLCDLHYVLPLPHHLGLAMHKEMRAPDGQAYRAEFACLFPWETGCHHFCFAALQHLSLSLPRSLSLSLPPWVCCAAPPAQKQSGAAPPLDRSSNNRCPFIIAHISQIFRGKKSRNKITSVSAHTKI
jgi:hypothetical protein